MEVCVVKLWEVTNGYMGESHVKCFVIADTQAKAIELGRAEYKREVDEELNKANEEYKKNIIKFGSKFAKQVRNGFRPMYDEDYYKNLKAECMCENTTLEWCSCSRDS